jgi:hypothetical protein
MTPSMSISGDTLAKAGKHGVSEATEAGLHASLHNRPEDPDLLCVLDAWPALPAHIKAAVLALIGTTR